MEEETRSAGTGPFKCPKCGGSTTGRYDFCSECGEPLTVQCPECGATWRFYLSHAYCPSCGTKIVAKSPVKKVKGWV